MRPKTGVADAFVAGDGVVANDRIAFWFEAGCRELSEQAMAAPKIRASAVTDAKPFFIGHCFILAVPCHSVSGSFRFFVCLEPHDVSLGNIVVIGTARQMINPAPPIAFDFQVVG